MGRVPFESADEVDAGGDVAPLVGPPELQFAVVVSKQVEKVICLKEHVGELGVRNAVLHARLHRLLLEHARNGKVFPYITKERYQFELLEPGRVVHHLCARWARAEIEEPFELLPLPGHVFGHGVLREQRALFALAARVPDQTGPATYEHDGFVPSVLKVRQQHHGHEIANLEATRRGIKAHISRDGSAGESIGKARCLIVDQAAPLEFVEKSIGHVRL